MHMIVHVCVCTHVRVCVYVCVCVRANACVHVCIHAYVCIPLSWCMDAVWLYIENTILHISEPLLIRTLDIHPLTMRSGIHVSWSLSETGVQ